MKMGTERPRLTVLGPAIVAGLLAGGIDIVYAIIANLDNGVTPTQVLQSVAAGLVGSSAYSGGEVMAALGLTAHLLIVVLMALLFSAAALRFTAVCRQTLVVAMVYGAIIYFGMRWIVVPLSRFPGDLRTFDAIEFAVHVFGVGVVISVIVCGSIKRQTARMTPAL